MSESVTSCPICNRPPGRVHRDSCPRSRLAQRDLDAQLESVGRPRIFWLKGPMAIRPPGSRRTKILYNPGIPYVKPPKHWRAGGVPRDTDAVEEFLRQVGVKA